MTHTEELTIEQSIDNLEVPGGGNSDEIQAFVKESQKILDKLIEDNKNLRQELKTEKSLRVQTSHKIVESSASMLEEASEIAAKYIEQAKEQAKELTDEANEYSDKKKSEADAYDEKVRKEADDYRASIVNEVETERDLIALEIEDLKASHAETKERIVSFHRSILSSLESSESTGEDAPVAKNKKAR